MFRKGYCHSTAHSKETRWNTEAEVYYPLRFAMPADCELCASVAFSKRWRLDILQRKIRIPVYFMVRCVLSLLREAEELRKYRVFLARRSLVAKRLTFYYIFVLEMIHVASKMGLRRSMRSLAPSVECGHSCEPLDLSLHKAGVAWSTPQDECGYANKAKATGRS